MNEEIMDVLENMYLYLGKEVPSEVVRRCQKVDLLIKANDVDGKLRSTQIIAMIIEQYERESK